MRGSRLLLIVGVILIVGALAVGAIFVMRGRQAPEAEPVAPDVTPVIPEVDVVVAAQDLPRNTYLGDAEVWGEVPAVRIESRPEIDVPEDAITDLEYVYGRTTRVDIPLGKPIVPSMLIVVREPTGSDAARVIPEGKVAYALPVARYSSVAWALQPGDYVDVVITLMLISVDEEFQTPLPNDIAQLSCDPECQGWRGKLGRLEVLPNGWVVMVSPAEQVERPRLVTQLTVDNARVLRVGDWPTDLPGLFEETTTEETEKQKSEEEPPPEEEVTPTAPTVAPLTLAVAPQDALVLDYAQLTGAHISLVLRRSGDNNRYRTEAVTLQYLMDRYNMEAPPKLPYSIEPRLIELKTVEPEEPVAEEEVPAEE